MIFEKCAFDVSWIYGKVETDHYSADLNAIASSITDRQSGSVVYFVQGDGNDNFLEDIFKLWIEGNNLDLKTIVSNWIFNNL